MSSEKAESLGKQGKELAGDFVSTVGLLDLIAGSVALYAAWLWFRSDVARLFPSTGISVVDIGLMAFAASLAGKLLLLLVEIGLAIVAVVVERFDVLGYHSSAETALHRYCNRNGIRLGEKDTDIFLLGTDLIAVRSPTLHNELLQTRNRATTALCGVLLAIPYGVYLWQQEAPTALVAGVILGAFLLLGKGVLEQLSYYVAISSKIKALPSLVVGQSDRSGS